MCRAEGVTERVEQRDFKARTNRNHHSQESSFPRTRESSSFVKKEHGRPARKKADEAGGMPANPYSIPIHKIP
jgi:hypothetical protein